MPGIGTKGVDAAIPGPANAALNKNIIDPALKDIADAGNDPDDLSWFVYGLENVSTGTYQSFAVGVS